MVFRVFSLLFVFSQPVSLAAKCSHFFAGRIRLARFKPVTRQGTQPPRDAQNRKHVKWWRTILRIEIWVCVSLGDCTEMASVFLLVSLCRKKTATIDIPLTGKERETKPSGLVTCRFCCWLLPPFFFLRICSPSTMDTKRTGKLGQVCFQRGSLCELPIGVLVGDMVRVYIVLVIKVNWVRLPLT